MFSSEKDDGNVNATDDDFDSDGDLCVQPSSRKVVETRAMDEAGPSCKISQTASVANGKIVLILYIRRE